MQVRLIESGAGDAPFNMALDEAIARGVLAGGEPPTVRFYGWSGPSLTLGSFQRKLDGIDTGFLRERGIPVVTRPTGGRAILHGAELTYSLSSRFEGVFFKGEKNKGKSKNLFECYALIAGAIKEALCRLGVPAELRRTRPGRAALRENNKNPQCFQSVSYGEITALGRKIAGSAQRRWTEGFLQQGSIPYRIDREMQKKVFLADFNPEAIGALEEFFVEGFNPRVFTSSLKEALEEALDAPLVPGEPTPGELEAARGLLEKYRLSPLCPARPPR